MKQEDLLIEVDPTIGLDFVILAEHFEAPIGLKVDMVSHRAFKPEMWKTMEKELIDV